MNKDPTVRALHVLQEVRESYDFGTLGYCAADLLIMQLLNLTPSKDDLQALKDAIEKLEVKQ